MGSRGGKRGSGIETRIGEWQGKTLEADCVVEQSQLLHVSLRLSAIQQQKNYCHVFDEKFVL